LKGGKGRVHVVLISRKKEKKEPRPPPEKGEERKLISYLKILEEKRGLSPPKNPPKKGRDSLISEEKKKSPLSKGRLSLTPGEAGGEGGESSIFEEEERVNTTRGGGTFP